MSREDIETLKGELAGLEREIDLVRRIEVAEDVGRKANSYDLALNTLFDSMEDVEKYAVHPAHLKVLDTIKRMCESTVKVDYQTEQAE